VKNHFVFGVKGQTSLDPFGKGGDLLVLELADGRHLVVIVLVGDHLKDQTLFGFCQVYGWTYFPTSQYAFPGRKDEIALDLLSRTMAFPAVFLQEWFGFFFPESKVLFAEFFLPIRDDRQKKSEKYNSG
jgi:hypothetical protein